MERAYEQRLGTILVLVGVAILLFVLYQAWGYTINPPSGNYNIFTLNGGGGGGNGGNVNGTLNGKFIATVTFLLVQALAGAFILKAGWNLISPKAETIQVRVKPKSLTVEPVGYSIPPSPSAAPTPESSASAGSVEAPPSSPASPASPTVAPPAASPAGTAPVSHG